MNDSKVIEKLGKIKVHMESAKAMGSEAEAQHFAQMLNQLLTKYKLEMTDLQYDMHVKDEPVEKVIVGGGGQRVDGKRVMKDYPDIEIKSSRVAWTESLLGVIARAHSCEILIHPGSSMLSLVGRKSNTAIVEYLFITMQRLMWKLSASERTKYWNQLKRDGDDVTKSHGFRDAWIDGFISRLRELFEEEAEKLRAEAAKNNTGTALMRIDKDAVATREFIESLRCGTANPVGRGRSWNAEGRRRGRAYADQVDRQGRGMGGAKATKSLKG